jgi:nucleotide-binding universal stress UspA family protein
MGSSSSTGVAARGVSWEKQLKGESVTQQAHVPVTTDSAEVTASNDKGRIVVGVDGSAGSMAALGWAVDEARVRGVSLHVVMTWEMPQTYGSPSIVGMGMDPSSDAKTVLAQAADEEAARLAHDVIPDDVPTVWEVVQGHPGWRLTELSEGAELLVVGSRGHGRFVGTLLGSVSQHVVAHAVCAVVVIPDPHRAAKGAHHRHDALAYRDGVFEQAHQHVDAEEGQGVYDQGHAEPIGQGVYDQGRSEVGGGVFDQGRSAAEDI